MAEPRTVQHLQRAFADHIRDPQHHPAPADVDPRRMALYRTLFYDNVESFIADSFPVVRRLFDEADWQALIRRYFAEHAASTPLFTEMPREFVCWLEQARPHAERLPFLTELAHFEWMEQAMAIADPDMPAGDVDPHGDLLDQAPVPSPLARLLVYAWPVHRLDPARPPQAMPDAPTCLLLYRDDDDRTGLLCVNPVTARLFELLAASPQRRGRQLLEHVAAEIGHRRPNQVVDHGEAVLADLRRRGILLGTRPPGI